MSPPHEPRMTGEKVCAKCGESKPVIYFPVCRHNKDGLLGSCRSCTADYEKGRRVGRKKGPREVRQAGMKYILPD